MMAAGVGGEDGVTCVGEDGIRFKGQPSTRNTSTYTQLPAGGVSQECNSPHILPSDSNMRPNS